MASDTEQTERRSVDRSSLSSLYESEPSRPSSASVSIDTDGAQSNSVSDANRISTFERVISTHPPIFESFLLQAPTDTIFQLYHTSTYLRAFLRSYPTAWQYLSFRLLYPSGTQMRIPGTQLSTRVSRPYALDQLLLQVVIPFSPSLRSLDLDNTAVSGQNLTSTVLNMRRDTLEHLSVRGCKNVSLKYHIIPYLTMFGLQYEADLTKQNNSAGAVKPLALKSLYAYRCRHHRRRPYLTSSLLRRDSDSEPTHELVKLCHKLGIWTDTAWCTTPASRCFRRRGYVSMRSPQGAPEVWVVFDRLWRSKNWIGTVTDTGEKPERDGRLWVHDETGTFGEAQGTANGDGYGEGKTVPTHLRRSYRHFVEDVKCDACGEEIYERCEQCSVSMHCVGCRKTLCYSCAYDTPYPRRKPDSSGDDSTERFWWAPDAIVSPCVMQEPSQNQVAPPTVVNNANPATATYPALKFHWCCTEPVFTGGGGISLGAGSRAVDRLRAVPLPRNQCWEDTEFSSNEWSKTFPKYAYGDPKRPDYSLAKGHAEMMRWLLGPPEYKPSGHPRNLCQECFDAPQWKVHCKHCSRPLCMEHDLRGLRLGICGYRDLHREKQDLQHYQENGNLESSTGTDGDHANIASQNQQALSQDDLGTGGVPIPRPLNVTKTLPGHSPPSQASPATPSNIQTGSSASSVYFESSPEPPKWLGCQSFFCPNYDVYGAQHIGDRRQRCSVVLKECKCCLVRVCQDCVQANQQCDCSFCSEHFLCPNCLQEKVRDGTCRRIEEERAKREEAYRQEKDKFALMLERNLANEVASFAGQFWGGLAEGKESEDGESRRGLIVPPAPPLTSGQNDSLIPDEDPMQMAVAAQSASDHHSNDNEDVQMSDQPDGPEEMEG